MKYLSAAVAIVCLATQLAVAAQPGKSKATNSIVAAGTTNNPVDAEYEKLLEEDDKAQEEVDRWIQDNDKFLAQGAGVPAEVLNRRIRNRFEPVRTAYEEFLKKHPDHVKARVAYGSFLGDIHDEEGAQEQLEKALTADTNNPAIYNNLANIYGHTGDIKKAFEFYSNALALNPREPVYYHNFATTVFLFRKDAKEFYGIEEQQVFDKALHLYSNALHFDPTNFPLASDVAQTYYGIKPPRTEDALKAWTNALSLAHDELEREGVYIHFARLKLHAGRFAEARAHLDSITNEFYASLKARLSRNIEELQNPTTTNSPATATKSDPRPGPPKSEDSADKKQ